MLKNIIIQGFFFFQYLIGFGQTADYTAKDFLPQNMAENSGVTFVAPNNLLFINDSGNEPEIFITDTLGKLKNRFCISGASNQDWEDITQDKRGNLYIADIGNNRNKRENLVIYKLKTSKVLANDNSFLLEEIHFTYEDQKAFPPKKSHKNFDAEAIIHHDGALYIFTKNRTKPFTGYTYCYKLPDSPGHFIAEKIDSFKTGGGVTESFWITGADFRENPNTLIFIGYDKLWMFYDFEGTDFFGGKYNVLYFNNFTQKEAITFSPDGHAFYSEEKNRKTDGKLYKLFLPPILTPQPNVIDKKPHKDSVYIKEKSFQNTIDIIAYAHKKVKAYWEVYNIEGQRLHYGQFEKLQKGENKLTIHTKDWNNGGYVLNIITGEESHAFKLKKPILFDE